MVGSGNIKVKKLEGLPINPRVLFKIATGLVYLVAGFSFLAVFWALVSYMTKEIPGPISTIQNLIQLLSNPFMDLGPNQKGIGWQVLTSLKRVFIGFFIGALIALPFGILIGMSQRMRSLLNPVVQVMRPVSPMAWFPIGLAVLDNSNGASIFVITITSLWPTLINTAVGVSSIPDDYKNVARVFGFSAFTYITKVLVPYALPYIFTGFRLSLGIGWMVIVASEMLAGGVGIGFFVWDSWNALNLENVLSAILIIGFIGLALDVVLNWFTERFRRA